MRLRLHAPDRLPFWIVGDPTHNERTEGSSALEMKAQISRDQSPVGGAAWDVKKFIDRGNGSVSYDLTARREFATEIERQDFIASLRPVIEADSLHGWSGDAYLRLTVPGSSTDEFKEWHLPGAVLALTGNTIHGACGLLLNYRLTAGGFNLAGTTTGTEKVYLTANGTRTGTCQMLLYLTTSGGPFDTAATIFTGTPPASLTVGDTLTIAIGDNFGTVTSKTFQVVAPGGSATGGNIAIETPVVDHLSVIATAFSGLANVTASAEILDGRKCVFLAWTAEPIDDPSEVIITCSVGYECGSTAAAFNPAVSANVWLTDDNGVYLVADHFTTP